MVEHTGAARMSRVGKGMQPHRVGRFGIPFVGTGSLLLVRTAYLILAIASLALPTSVHAETRAALVIGNNNYERLTRLANAINDSTAIAAELRRVGFTVTEMHDAAFGDINSRSRAFLKTIANGGVGLFYFSGHGVQIDGRSFLVPVDYSLDNRRPSNGLISLPDFLDAIDAARPKLAVIVLDACRDDPFPAATSGSPPTRGLSEVARPLPAGTLVLYAASSNQTALDGTPGEKSRHGLFTGTLLDTIGRTELEIRDVAHRVRYIVMQKARAVGHRQIPAIYDNVAAGEFYLARREPPPPRIGPAPNALPKTIKLILPFAAGGPSDVLLRSTLPLLAKELDREVVAENLIDVQGDRVAALIAGGPKDGSHLLISPFAASARRFKAEDRRLAPVAMLLDTPLSIAVHTRSSARTLGEIVEGAKREARKLVMQVSNPPGSPTDICGQQTVEKLGRETINLVRVNGEALAVKAVLDGAADLACVNTIALRSMISSQPNFGLKEVAEVRWSATPSTDALRVQATGPQGYDITAPNWLAVFAAAEVPADVRETIAAAISRLQRNSAFVAAAKKANGLPVSQDQATSDGLLNALRLGVALQDPN